MAFTLSSGPYCNLTLNEIKALHQNTVQVQQAYFDLIRSSPRVTLANTMIYYIYINTHITKLRDNFIHESYEYLNNI